MRLVDGDVVLLLHAVDQLLDELLELLGGHRLELLAHALIEHVAIEQRVSDGIAQVLQRLLVGVLIVVILILALETALQQLVGESGEQVLEAHLRGRFGDVFLVFDEFHRPVLARCS